MTKEVQQCSPLLRACLTLALVTAAALAQAHSSTSAVLPNMGQSIAPQGLLQPLVPDVSFTGVPGWQASQAVTTVVSPLGDTLLVLTSGYNRLYTSDMVPAVGTAYNVAYSNEYVFVYDISTGTPVYQQTLALPNAYNGIVFDPSGLAFYVSGGPPTGRLPAPLDEFHVFTLTASTGTWAEPKYSPISLGHLYGNGLNLTSTGPAPINEGVAVFACSAGLAISNDGNTLVAANYYNDSITVFDKRYGTYDWVKRKELDLRPGKSNPILAGVPGGEYPFWVAVKGNGLSATAYVSSIRDREIDVVSLGGRPVVTARIRVKGQPNKMTLNGLKSQQSLLFVAEDQSDTVDVIDTTTNTIRETIPVMRSMVPARLAQYTGANPNSVTLSPDETQLYVTDGNLNCISVVQLNGSFTAGKLSGYTSDHVVGLIPTGWYPNSAAFSNDGRWVFVVNSKSATGPNPLWCYGGYGPVGYLYCADSNQYTPQLTKAGLQSFPFPTDLTAMTQAVLANDNLSYQESDSDKVVMAAVHKNIQHVIFILKENRTYDQILGDLPSVSDAKYPNNKPAGDPTLTLFGKAITPNEHALAQRFVTLDHFFATAEVSADGWAWSTSAQIPDVLQREWPVAYAYRGLSLEGGLNRNVNVAIPTLAERQMANPFTSSDPDVLPGQTDIASPDGPNNEINTGYLWDSALRAGLTVRNYGFLLDVTRYFTPSGNIPLSRNPFETGIVQAIPCNIALAPFTDPYFRGFDPALPDFYRYAEWEREFNSYASGGLPALSLVRFMGDHTGSWAAGKTGFPPATIDGVNTPDLEVADNDYAVGLLVQKIANSAYANNTLIFVVEDDAQDGGDHIDAHRTTAFIVGPYVNQGAVIQTSYNTVNFVRTMEEVLGLGPMNLNDAVAKPMTDVFNMSDLLKGTPSTWSFTAAPAPILYNTQLLLPPKAAGLIVPKVAHDAKYWARVTKGMDFTDADRVDSLAFNRILWKGMMGDKPYPATLARPDSRKGGSDDSADDDRPSSKRKAAHPAPQQDR